jgi:acyl-CoA thioesterase II
MYGATQTNTAAAVAHGGPGAPRAAHPAALSAAREQNETRGEMTIQPVGGTESPDSAAIHALLGISETSEHGHWKVTVHEGVQTGSLALHGGSAFASAIEAMVATTGRPAVWATAQFVAHAPSSALLDLWVVEVSVGHRITQARARLEHDGHEVLSAMGAFGTRPFDVEQTWAKPLEVPRPEDCERRVGGTEGLMDLWQARVAAGRGFKQLDGRPGSGRSASWYRIPNGRRVVTAGDLAVLGDFTVLELDDALGSAVSGNSLDNTLRVSALSEAEWILVDTQVSAVERGFASLTAHLWSDLGALLGVASQTLVMRRIDADGHPLRTTKRFAGQRYDSGRGPGEA